MGHFFFLRVDDQVHSPKLSLRRVSPYLCLSGYSRRGFDALSIMGLHPQANLTLPKLRLALAERQLLV